MFFVNLFNECINKYVLNPSKMYYQIKREIKGKRRAKAGEGKQVVRKKKKKRMGTEKEEQLLKKNLHFFFSLFIQISLEDTNKKSPFFVYVAMSFSCHFTLFIKLHGP